MDQVVINWAAWEVAPDWLRQKIQNDTIEEIMRIDKCVLAGVMGYRKGDSDGDQRTPTDIQEQSLCLEPSSPVVPTESGGDQPGGGESEGTTE